MPLVNKTFSDIITFSRASSATMFDSSGTLVYAPMNAIRNNTGVGAVAGTPGTLPTNWTSASIGGVALTEVVGTGVEDSIAYVDVRYTGTTSSTASGGITAEGTNQIVAASGQTWTNSFYVRLVNGSLSGINTVANTIQERDSGGNLLAATNTAITPTTAPLNTQRVNATRTLNNASTAFVNPQVRITPASGVAIDITLRIGLPQLELGSVARTAVATSGTAYQGPRLDYDPATLAARGLLIEEQRTNLATYSAALDDALGWAPQSGLTVTANAITSPDGTLSAERLASNGISQGFLDKIFAITSGTTYTFSCFFKKHNTSTVQILIYGSQFNSGGANVSGTFNLDTGIATGVNGTASMTAVGNGWYRCVLTKDATTTGSFPQQTVRMASATGDVYAWGLSTRSRSLPNLLHPHNDNVVDPQRRRSVGGYVVALV
jgi:hypothetical protein